MSPRAADSAAPVGDSRVAKAVLVACSSGIGLALAFGIFHFVMPGRGSSDRDGAAFQHIVPDRRLGSRVAPGTANQDAKGFRNDAVPKHADVVAIGDSQTWGVNAARAEAWPQQLGALSGIRVYNMSCSGWGPAQYLELTSDALELGPKVIVIGFYFGNDLYNAYEMTYLKPGHESFADPALRSELSRDTVGPKADVLGADCGMARAWPFERTQAWALAHPGDGVIFERGATHTVLTVRYRLTGIDLDEPRIAEGLRLSSAYLAAAKAVADKGGARLAVLFIPSKERIYATAMGPPAGALASDHARLATMEDRARAVLLASAAQSGVEVIDPLPDLVRAASDGEAIYPGDQESHFNPRGYRLLARTVTDALHRLRWLDTRPAP